MFLSPWKKTVSFTTAIILSLGFGYYVGQAHGVTNSNQSTTKVVSGGAQTDTTNNLLNFSLLNQSWSEIKNNFYFKDRIDTQEGVYGAAEGLINSLKDPYTIFLSPTQSDNFNDSLHGSLEGIGAELGILEGNLTVTGVIKDSPAFKGGLKPKDIIYKINNDLASNFNLSQAVEKIRGPRGSLVTLTVIHDGEKNTSKIDITRDVIDLKVIEYEMKGDIAVISIHKFTDDTKHNLWAIGDEIKAKHPKGIILDLRWDPGGYLDAAIDVTSFFVKDGIAVKKILRTDQESSPVTGNVVIPDLPMVVLINGGSASASEIVAGALRDNHRATLVGEKSFGKGTIQEVHPLPNGASLKITVGKWFPPLGEDIDHKGIAPDVEIKLDEAGFAKDKDNQMDRALEEVQKIIAKKK